MNAITSPGTLRTAYTVRNLSVLNYANGFSLWHYRHPGALDETLAPLFFAPAADMFNQGDVIMISARDGCAMRGVCKSECGQVALTAMR